MASKKGATSEKIVSEVSHLGGTKGIAMVKNKPFPTQEEVLKAIPAACRVRDTPRSIRYAIFSLVVTLVPFFAARLLIPLSFWAIPLWIAHALILGTIATGMWVVAHECGHNAFSDNKLLQDAVGYVYHTVLLVPYFSWQRSHAVHHSRTNHLMEGETHVPSKAEDCKDYFESRHSMGEEAFSIVNIVKHLLFGWPAYLLAGVSGGPIRGLTSHFVPANTGEQSLFPNQELKLKVLLSDVGILVWMWVLYKWYLWEGSFVPLLAMYFGPYLGVNCWLVGYTWLHHTDVDVPHYNGDDWNWVKGALLTIDRPFPWIVDVLHHQIGTTHVAHHVCPAIPHYHAREATDALKKAFPDHYLYDPTPVHLAMWRVASHCLAVRPEGDMWVYTDGSKAVTKPRE